MKTLATILLALLMSFPGLAQVTPDTTNISIGDKKIILIDPTPDQDTTDVTLDSMDDDGEEWDADSEKGELTHWGGIDFGVNMLMAKDGGLTMDSTNSWLDLDYSRSLSWRINLVEEKIRLYKDYIGIIIGAGLTYNSYGLKNNVDIMTQDSSATYGVAINDTIRDYSKNKFRASYIHVPLMLEFNTSNDNEKSFHVAAGVIGGWKMGSITKQKWEDNDEKYQVRRKADYNLTPFTLDATARIGYKNFTVFASYGLTPLFEKNKGPEVYPITVGLQIVPF
jgi:Outer membrane protein beta-barrel domain